MIENFRPFIISFLIGFLIGIERERSHPKGSKAFGMRTFVLFALLGTLAAQINTTSFTITISAFVFAAILLGYSHATRRKRIISYVGLTTEMAAGVVFCLGYLVQTQPLLASMLGAIVLVILLGKKRLHDFARHQLQPKEIKAAVTIIIIGLGILPFLPNHTIDPWHLFNPRRFGILILLLAVLQFGGYVAIRVFGSHLGVILLGFFGGVVSSTAMFVNLPSISRYNPQLIRPLIVGSVYSVIGMLCELSLILFAAAPSLIISIIGPIIAMILVGATSALLMLKGNTNTNFNHSTNPLDVKSVVRLGSFIAGMLIIATIASRLFGEMGVHYVTFFGALFEVQGVSLATATLYLNNKLNLADAGNTVLVAILATYISKFVLLWTFNHNRYTLFTTLYLIAMLMAGFAVYFFLPGPLFNIFQLAG